MDRLTDQTWETRMDASEVVNFHATFSVELWIGKIAGGWSQSTNPSLPRCFFKKKNTTRLLADFSSINFRPQTLT